MQKINFKKETLDKLLPKNKPYNVIDQKIAGLTLTVYPSGVKSYTLFRKINKRSHRLIIGRYSDFSIEQVRTEAAKINLSIASGHNPFLEKKASQNIMRFKELYSFYYNVYATNETKRPDDNLKMMEFHIFPVWGHFRITEIDIEMANDLHATIGETRGKGTANRVMTVVKAVFNFAIKKGKLTGNNPCIGIKKFKSKSRDRFLQGVEIKEFFDALQLEDVFFQDYFSLLLYTGVRKTNLMKMRWKEVNFELEQWRLPETDTKNGDVNIITLAKPALQILRRRNAANKESLTPSLFVFPGTGKSGHLIDPKKSFKRIKARMGINDIRIHDLRRTLGSYMAITGASLPIIGNALSHKSADSTEIYARLMQEPVANAINTAIVGMIGNTITGLFKENTQLCISKNKFSEVIRFNDLIAA